MALTLFRSSMHHRSHFVRSRLAMMIAMQCAGLALGAASPAFSESMTSEKDVRESMRDLDWIPLSELTEEQKALVPVACCGAYIAPVRTDEEADIDPENAKIFGTADYSEAERQTKFTMHSDVRLTQGRRSFEADTFTFDNETREAEMLGNIQVREPGMLLRAERAFVDTNTGNAQLDDARFVMYETRVHGRAEKLEKFGDRIISLDSGYFTSCEPGDNTWAIRGDNITINNDKRYGTAKHMRLTIKDVPVAYSPYFRFPVGPDRLTGFLFPSLGLDEKDVIREMTVPFYWNIAPNYDATLTWRYLAEHGNILKSEFRHLSPSFETELLGSYLHSDRGGYSERLEDQIRDGTLDAADAYPYKGEDRWQYNIYQTGGRNQAWSTLIDYTDVSDTDYLRDVDKSSIDLNRQAYLRQRVEGRYKFENWSLRAKAEEFRLLTDRQLPYRELPRINVDGNYRFDDWVVDLQTEYVNFDVNRYFQDNPTQAATIPNLILGERLRGAYSVTLDNSYLAGFFRPSVGVKTLSYQLEAGNLNPDADDSPYYVAPQALLDTGLFFERDTTLFDNGFTQTLEPRAYYLYRDYESQDDLGGITTPQSRVNFDSSDLIVTYQQLFRDSRFSGGDRIDDANQLTLGVTSRLVDAESGIERIRASIGQITYFDDRKVNLRYAPDSYENTRSQSAIAGQLNGQIGDHLRLSNDVLYDHQEGEIKAFSSSLHYMDDAYRIVNFRYRYSRDPAILSPLDATPRIGDTLNQVDISTIWPVSNQWSVIARANYDFNFNAELDTFAGLEYTDCCYRVRVLARQWVDFDFSEDFLKNIKGRDYDRGVFVEVQLRGIGTLSQRISNLLDKAMLGYSEREASLQ